MRGCMRTLRRGTQIARKLGQTAGDGRGVAFVSALFIMFAAGMMLFGFVFLSQNEVGFAAFNRNSIQALGLAEAGAQEAVKRLAMFGSTPGVTAFANSLAARTPGGSGQVTVQPAFQSNPGVFPILSVATFAGTRRAVRILEQANFITGLGNVLSGPQVIYEGIGTDVPADTYSLTFIIVDAYRNSPLCSLGTTATNLLPPELLAGTGMRARPDANITPPCGAPTNAGTYAYECASGSLTEVAPTPCPGGGRAVSGGNPVPYNWHPMTPIGMSSADFTTVVTQCPTGCSSLGLGVVQATQNGTGVTYTSKGTYTPSYWISVSSTNGKVMLITATQPFCVRASPVAAQLPSGGSCPAGFDYYTNYNDPEITTALGAITQTARFVDWGLVQDDLSRGTAQRFFQPPTCTTCNGGNPNGNQNGIRYIPLLPPINVLAKACVQNVNPGTNVFDQVNTADGITCANPPTQTINSTSVAFTGTKANPEGLVIDNAGMGSVTISSSAGTPATCSTTNFDSANWGIILATGDLTLPTNFVLTGYIYTQGNVSIPAGTVVIRGGLFAANLPGSSSTLKQIDMPAAVHLCGGQNPYLFNPLVAIFQALSWHDRPLNQP